LDFSAYAKILAYEVDFEILMMSGNSCDTIRAAASRAKAAQVYLEFFWGMSIDLDEIVDELEKVDPVIKIEMEFG
jgi:ACT domain-containing protein